MPKPASKLLTRQRQVIDYYFGPAMLNKAAALRMAGYKTTTQYHHFWNKPAVAAEVARREEELQARYSVTYDRTIAELAKVAYSNIGDFIEVDPESGDFVIRLNQANAHQLAAIGELKVKRYMEGKGENAKPVQILTLKPWNKVAALDALIRHAGLSKDKVKVSVEGDLIERINAGRSRVAPAIAEEPHGDDQADE